MNPLHKCRYCNMTIDETEPGWLYAIEDNEDISRAHTECIEVIEGITVNEPIEWII